VKPQTLNPEPINNLNPFDHLKHVKTLLVDDDEFIRNSLELAFKTKGCPLHVVQSAEEGMQALKNQPFDIIISDLRLPGVSGLDFLKLTSVTHPNAIRFLITAYRDDRILAKAIRSGIDQLIDKPFAIDSLVHLLALAVKRQMQNGPDKVH
jgi:DNA-binding NtrC family response regulator